MRLFLSHPIISIVIGIIGVFIGALSLVEPAHPVVTDGEKCGYNEKQTEYRDYQYKSCSDPAHGVEGYQYTETVSGSSGWRGGGYNQQAWCNDVKRAKERAVGQSIVWGPEQRGESNRKTLLGHAEYNYWCTIEAKWGPIYRVQRSVVCGEEPMKIKVQKDPRTCVDVTVRNGWKWRWQ